ncbi:MAG: hypothetical protein LUF29_03270 [Oscillospiraceae bacterium]|nr:hypothetical protein [Oscillospiraceae bacterium]
MPDSDFSRMQQEALDRMREMQRRSRTVVNPPPPPQEPSPAPNPPPSPPISQPTKPAFKPSLDVNSLFKNILGDGLKLDSEKALILMMLFVLYKNKADVKLLVALGYLLL